MPIETNFHFNQIRNPDTIHRLGLGATDLLGPLRAFIGNNHQRTWSGPGFNLIWRPHDKSGSNNQDFFLELDVTKEILSFTDITGPTGIANRGLLQPDIALGGLAYQQEVSNVTVVPAKPLHFEPGVWVSVPQTTNPDEKATVARMGSIPHGTTINAQGISIPSPTGKPLFEPSSIVPFKILGNDGKSTPDDGATNLINFPEASTALSTDLPSRTLIADLVGITDAHFQNPTKILSDVADTQDILSTQVFIVNTDVAAPNSTQGPNPGRPQEGGGIDNIGFLVGSGAGPNANAARMTAIFWVEDIRGTDGVVFQQLQYIQRVLLNFNGLSWPHISLATMVKIAES